MILDRSHKFSEFFFASKKEVLLLELQNSVGGRVVSDCVWSSMEDACSDWCPVCLGLGLYVLSFLLLNCLESSHFADLNVLSKLFSASSQHVTPN